MVKPLYPSRLTKTVTVTNEHACPLWLCPCCLKPFTRKQEVVRHLTHTHKLPEAEVKAHVEELVSVPARKTTTLRFGDPRRKRVYRRRSQTPRREDTGPSHD